MIDIIIVLILFIVCSSIKALYLYIEIGLGYYPLLLHVITTLGFSAIFTLLTLKRKWRIWFVMWYLLYAFVLFVNTNFFEFYGKFIHLSSTYVLIPEVLMLTKNLGVPLDAADLIFVIDIPLFLYLLYNHEKIKLLHRHLNSILKITTAVSALATVTLYTIPVYSNSESLAQLEDYNTVSRYGIFGHNVIDVLKPHEINRFSKIKYGPKVIGHGEIGKRPNIILIQVESLDANIVNYRYHGKYVTPFLHHLTTKSIYFPFTLSYHRMGGTSDCEIAVNNSIEPFFDFPFMKDSKYDYPNSVVKVLKKNGYSIEAFHGNTGHLFNRISAYTRMGYDNFFDSKHMNLPSKGWGVPDHDVMDYVEKHLQEKKTPFFVSIITLTSHEPFNNMKHFVPDNRFDGVEPRLTRDYFASIAYTDRIVGEFITHIQNKYPDTYFFLYGDHTPYVINEGPFRRSVLSNQAMEMVPLLIISPDGRSRYEHDAVASYLDIAPTILHVAGVPYSYKALGVDLLSKVPLQQPVIFSGHPYNRSDLFKEVTETFKDQWNIQDIRGAK